MVSQRITRVNELLRREIASALFKVITNPKFNPASVTITEVKASRDLRSALVFVSVYGENGKEQLHFIRQHRSEIQNLIAQNIVLKYTPHLRFQLDPTIQRGDKILHILDSLEDEEHV